MGNGETLRTDLPKHLCVNGINGTGCSLTTFHTHGISHSQVCGKIIGYQDQTPGAFGQGQSQQIDGHYVEGISLTHGRNPRKHIWTFAAALREIGNELPADSSVLVLIELLLHLQHHHLALSEMTIFVILVVQSKLMASFMVMIHCGMEQVVGL